MYWCRFFEGFFKSNQFECGILFLKLLIHFVQRVWGKRVRVRVRGKRVRVRGKRVRLKNFLGMVAFPKIFIWACSSRHDEYFGTKIMVWRLSYKKILRSQVGAVPFNEN